MFLENDKEWKEEKMFLNWFLGDLNLFLAGPIRE